ncbi:MAG: SRPBCC domain-containing protein [Cytophagaceae bacterium]|nr:SRPBCC domain-containing protein [Cytophagaceae bacterium]
MENYIVQQSVKIKAQPSKVWDALTNPNKTKKYFFHCKVFSDWKQGSTITFKGKLFYIFPIEMTGKIQAVEQNKLLKYTLNNGKSNTHSTVTDRLSFADGITTLSISDDVGQGEGAEKRYKRSVKGWEKVLKGLKKLVEEAN